MRAQPILVILFAVSAALAPPRGGYPPPTKHGLPDASLGVLSAPATLRHIQKGAEAILQDLPTSRWQGAEAAVAAVTSDEHDLEMAALGSAVQARAVIALRQAAFALVEATGVHNAAQSTLAARRVLACCADIQRQLERPPAAGSAPAATLGGTHR